MTKVKVFLFLFWKALPGIMMLFQDSSVGTEQLGREWGWRPAVLSLPGIKMQLIKRVGGVALSFVELADTDCKLCLPRGKFGYMCRE